MSSATRPAHACRTKACTSRAGGCLCQRIYNALDVIEATGWTHQQLAQVVMVLKSMARAEVGAAELDGRTR